MRFDGDVVTTAKVQTVNSQVSTECPEYERSLFVRIFHPVDVKEHNLIRCTLSCGGQIFKTGVLDDKGDEVCLFDKFTIYGITCFELLYATYLNTVLEMSISMSSVKYLPSRHILYYGSQI